EDVTVRLRQALTMSRNLHLVVKRSGEELLDFLLEKPAAWKDKEVLLWTWAPSPQDVLALTRPGQIYICHVHIKLAVSTSNGTTFLFTVSSLRCLEKWQNLDMKENGRCSPGLLPWPKESLPEPLCVEWQPHGSDESTLRVMAFAPLREHRPVIQPFEKFIGNLVASVRPAVKLEWVPGNESSYEQVFAREANCNISTLLSFFPMTIRVEPHLQYQSGDLSPVVVVVPASLGPHPGLLKAVTAEFSVALWVATALAVGGITVALAVASTCRGRPRLTALAAAPLQALAAAPGAASPG
ncbi:Ionotropic receptor 211, partial [Frankliniella occidentalis]